MKNIMCTFFFVLLTESQNKLEFHNHTFCSVFFFYKTTAVCCLISWIAIDLTLLKVDPDSYTKHKAAVQQLSVFGVVSCTSEFYALKKCIQGFICYVVQFIRCNQQQQWPRQNVMSSFISVMVANLVCLWDHFLMYDQVGMCQYCLVFFLLHTLSWVPWVLITLQAGVLWN